MSKTEQPQWNEVKAETVEESNQNPIKKEIKPDHIALIIDETSN